MTVELRPTGLFRDVVKRFRATSMASLPTTIMPSGGHYVANNDK